MITSINPDSILGKVNKINIGDQLLAVNDTILLGSCHDVAISTLVKARGNFTRLVFVKGHLKNPEPILPVAVASPDFNLSKEEEEDKKSESENSENSKLSNTDIMMEEVNQHFDSSTIITVSTKPQEETSQNLIMCTTSIVKNNNQKIEPLEHTLEQEKLDLLQSNLSDTQVNSYEINSLLTNQTNESPSTTIRDFVNTNNNNKKMDDNDKIPKIAQKNESESDNSNKIIAFLPNDGSPLGISILGGEPLSEILSQSSNQGNNNNNQDLNDCFTGIYISKIAKDSAAYNNKTVKQGQQIVSVNGIKLENYSHEQFLNLMFEDTVKKSDKLTLELKFDEESRKEFQKLVTVFEKVHEKDNENLTTNESAEEEQERRKVGNISDGQTKCEIASSPVKIEPKKEITYQSSHANQSLKSNLPPIFLKALADCEEVLRQTSLPIDSRGSEVDGKNLLKFNVGDILEIDSSHTNKSLRSGWMQNLNLLL